MSKNDQEEKNAGFFSYLKSRYGALVAAVSFVAEFIKPAIEFTVPLLVITGVAGLWFFAKSRRKQADELRDFKTLQYFCFSVFLLCSGFLLLREVVPGAQANGSTSGIPGISAVQDKVLSHLAGIQGDSARIRQLLEEQAERDRADSEYSEKIEKENAEIAQKYQAEEKAILDAKQQRIISMGYTPDTEGYFEAIRDNYGNMDDFDELDIKPTRDIIINALKKDKSGSIVQYISMHKDDTASLRQINEELENMRKNAWEAYKHQGKTVLCDEDFYALDVSRDTLRRICKLEGIDFARSYFYDYLMLLGNSWFLNAEEDYMSGK